MSKTAAPFPAKTEILEFIRNSPTPVGKREIARAFHLDFDQKLRLKALLQELKVEGSVDPAKSRRIRDMASLPPVTILKIASIGEDILLVPAEWDDREPPPVIILKLQGSGREPLRPDMRLLGRLRRLENGCYEASLIRLLDQESARLVGVFNPGRDGGGRVELADRKARGEIQIEAGHTLEARAGDLVLLETHAAARLGLKRGRVRQILGRADDPSSISLIAIASRDIPVAFSDQAIAQAEAATIPGVMNRTDLRDVPLVTIDGEDARDFDDAVFAEADSDPANNKGWHLIVAIADVSHYVTPGSALDREASRRGNSVYFPDRVVPMLPEALSNGLCSLKPGEPRACLAFDMWIDANGNLIRRRLLRGLMRSVARLTYTQVQAARNGAPDDTTGPLLVPVIEPLYGAYETLLRARDARGTLEIDLPERKVSLGEDGRVAAIVERERFASHKLIEEFMILANVAAAELAEAAKQPILYRVHDRPAAAKLDSVRDFIRDMGLSLPKGQMVKPAQLTQLLHQASGTPQAQLINEVVLRAQAQAVYSPDNIGHFGLALRRYAHFTSPIRRYADLVVHRSLIALQKLGSDGITEAEIARLDEIGEHVSHTERRAAEAERDAISRYTAAFMSSHIGEIFEGRISGVSRFGLFVKLFERGAEGLIPISTLPNDFYIHEEEHHRLVGRRTRTIYRLTDRITVKLREADPITGSTLFSIVGQTGGDGSPAPIGRSVVKAADRRGGKPRGKKKRRPA